MIVAGALALYAVLVGTVGNTKLAGAAWPARHPRAAVTIWHSAAAGCVLAVAAALMLTAHDLTEHGLVWLICARPNAVHSMYSGGLTLGPGWNFTGLLLVAAVIYLAATAAVRLSRDRRRRNLCLSGQTEPSDPHLGEDVRVVRDPAALVYCLSAPPRARPIVVSTGALAALGAPGVMAAIEHERAHLSQRHHLSVLVADLVRGLTSKVGLMKSYSLQVRRLCEMAADDAASHPCGGRTVARALLDLSDGPLRSQPVAVLGVVGTATGERIRRLIAGCGDSHADRVRVRRTARWVGLAVAALPFVVAMAPALAVIGTVH
ncbi:M56 family metallopeptidase [Solicola sp. PLA-1-18]|uniref:M56 family metallopeptidase n=1 Tax=Solicola sp. PLA-1-18 TaxID=3380532 RepID=UPI003B7F0650